MNISKKWQAAAVGAIALALVAGGTVSAHAAPGDPVNPQPNGSPGSFFLFDGNTGDPADGDASRVYLPGEQINASASSTDLLAELNPAATRPITGATPFNQVWAFISDRNPAARDGGTATWEAFHADSAAGPNGGTLVPDMTLESFTSGGPAVIAAGGNYWYGIAYTINAGVTVVGSVYREINIQPGGNYTVGAVVVEGAGPGNAAPAVTTQPANAAVAPGADATFTAAASGTPTPTVQWESSTDGTTWTAVAGATSPSLTVPAVTVAQNATQYRAVFTNTAGAATSNAATLTVGAVAPTAPVEADLTPARQNTALVTETVDSKSLAINAGAAAANQTLTFGSFPAGLNGTVTLDANGAGTIDATAVPVGQATKLWLSQPDYTGLTWDSFTLTATPVTPGGRTDQEIVNLIVDVTASDRFEIVAAANWVNPVDLGDVRRNVLSPIVKLGDFKVIDDRNVLTGWTLNATTAAFAGATGATIGADALGFDFFEVGGVLTGVTDGAPKAAGNGVATGIAATGADLTSTTEEGATLNADLTFLAPASAVRDTYTSTLTLDLIAD